MATTPSPRARSRTLRAKTSKKPSAVRTRLTLQVKGFKPQPDPYKDKGDAASFRMRAVASALPPALLDWMKVNPREQKLTGPVIKGMSDTWDEYPKEFHRCNRGLLLFARELRFDSESETVTLVLQDPKLDGVGDGGHTLRHVVENLVPKTVGAASEEDREGDADEDDESELEPIERYVEVEVLCGLRLEEIGRIARARNTSKNVPDYAIKTLEGAFDPLKDILRKFNRDYAENVVAFKPYEHIEGTKDFKPVSILEVLQILTCMDITNYTEDDHPIEAYKNRGFGPKFFVERAEVYKRMYPIVGDILQLFDEVRRRVPESYNSKGRRWGKIIKEPISTGSKDELYYVDPSGNSKVPKAPNALFFPMLSAFRAAIQDDGKRYGWIDGNSPAEWDDEEFEEVLGKLALKIASAVRNHEGNFNSVGRDNQVWDACFGVVDKHLYATGRRRARGRGK